MPNMEELINQISSELSKNQSDPIWISVIGLDYAYRQIRLAPETSKHCKFAITGEKINGCYRFLKGFYAPADIPTIFQEKIDRTLGHQIPVWLDDIIIATRGTKEQHTQKLESVLTKLENEGYKASKKKSKFYQKETIWLGYTISQDGIRPNKKNGSHQQTGPTNKHQNTQIISRRDTIFRKIHTKPIRKNRQYAAAIGKRDKMGVDGRT